MVNSEQTRQVIHLYIEETDKHYYFGSLQAMFESFSPEQLGVAIQTLYNTWNDIPYINDKVTIRKGRLIQKKHSKTNKTQQN